MNAAQTLGKVSELLSFIKDQVKIDLVESNTKKVIDVDRDQLEKIVRVVALSIESNFVKGSSIIENEFKK